MTRLDALLRAASARVDPTDAALLLAHALQRPHTWLYAHGDDAIDAAAAARFQRLLERRVAGEPVAYLTGRRGFWRFDLRVTPDTLIPRPETELLVELALERLPAGRALRVADLGTGSGAIALALARERPAWQVIATDRSAEALEIAAVNCRRLRIDNVELRQGSWCEPLAGERFDAILSNPPYIAPGDAALPALRHEPIQALVADDEGFADLLQIARAARAHLKPGGLLLMEHGAGQSPRLLEELARLGYRDAASHPDLAGHDRVVQAVWP